MTQRKIALVTGSSRGLGRDMAIRIAKKGKWSPPMGRCQRMIIRLYQVILFHFN